MELEEAGELLKSYIQKNLKANIWRFGFADYQGVGNKTASFALYNNVDVSIKEGPNKIIINLALLDYADYVDRGRAKGLKMVPINALLKWIKDRKLKGRDKKTGQFISNEQFAWGIRKNIQKFGIRPNGATGKGFIDLSINQFMNDPKLDDMILDYGMKMLDLKLNKIFYKK